MDNDQFRRARERTESPTQPGECLSRHELADLVNQHIWMHHQQRVVTDANYIGKLERGVICWPSTLYREALRAVLGATTDAALGFTNRRRTVVQLTNVDRKQFLRSVGLGVGALTLAPVVARLQGSEPTPVPSQVGSAEIGQITAAAAAFATWDHTYGGGLAREAVQAQLLWSAALLDARCDQHLRGPLCSAIGYLAHTCGFMAFDAYAHDDATNAFQFGLACAEQVGDWHLRAKILSSMARHAIWIGKPDDGLTFVEHALVRADRLTATERAMLHTAHARALAKMQRTRDALAAVGRADDEFARATPVNDPPWMSYYDRAQHVGDTGHALFDLALHGYRPEAAAARLSAAVTGHTDAYTRSRAISQTKLATLTMATGDPAEGVALGNAALDAAGTVRSCRAADDLRELSRYAQRHGRTPGIARLRQRIHTVVASS